MLLKLIVCFAAGIGAGPGTGFAGISAAAVISPMLITFLGMTAYEAVGIALASDVLASAVRAYTYRINKNFDVKNGIDIKRLKRKNSFSFGYKQKGTPIRSAFAVYMIQIKIYYVQSANP